MGDMIDLESLDLFKDIDMNNSSNNNNNISTDYQEDNDIEDIKKKKKVKKLKEPKENGSKGFLSKLKDFPGMKGRRMFTQMCILAGCDYSESINGIGLINAQLNIIKYKNIDCNERLNVICEQIKLTKTVDVDYLDRVNRAEKLFHYHVIYDPFKKSISNFMSPLLLNSIISPSSSLSTVLPSLPLISPEDLINIGTEASLLINAPVDVTIDSICEGNLSI